LDISFPIHLYKWFAKRSNAHSGAQNEFDDSDSPGYDFDAATQERVDEIEDRILELNGYLDDCPETSPRHNIIQEEIDRLEDCLDKLEDDDF